MTGSGERSAPATPPDAPPLTRRRDTASIVFAVVDFAAAAYVLVTLIRALIFQAVVRLFVEQNAFFRFFAPAWFLIPLGLLGVAALAIIEGRKSLARWRRMEREPDVGLRFRVLAYCATACAFVGAFFLSTPESFAGPFRIRYPILGDLATAVAYGMYVVWWALLPRLRRWFPRRLSRGLDVVAMNVVVLLVLLELAVRVAALVRPSPLLVTESSPSQIRRDANREPPGILRFGFPMNSGGHYDTEFVPRSETPHRLVLDIGDSFSYGAVPHPFHFTTVAERILGSVDIYNMGYSGLGPSDYLYLLEREGMPLRPDVVVVNIFVGNDLSERSAPPGIARWYDADRYLVAIVWNRLLLTRRARMVDAANAIPQTDLTPEQLSAFYPQIADPSLETPSVGEDLYYAVEIRNAEAIALPREGLYKPFFATLLDIQRAAGKTPVAFVLIPEEFQVEDDVWQELLRRTGRPLDRDLAQHTMLPWLKGHGLPALDLLPLLRAVPPMKDGRRHLYHLRNLHFNARGNDVAGRALAHFVDSLLALTPANIPLPRLVFGRSATRRWMETGWQLDESFGGRSYAWSSGMRSTLKVPLPRGRDVRMDFEVNPLDVPDQAQRVAILVNGKPIQEVSLRPGMQRYSAVVPKDVLLGSPNIFEFRYAYARSPHDVTPSSPDIRNLAVAWYSLTFSALDH